jgi:hypothetical protein
MELELGKPINCPLGEQPTLWPMSRTGAFVQSLFRKADERFGAAASDVAAIMSNIHPSRALMLILTTSVRSPQYKTILYQYLAERGYDNFLIDLRLSEPAHIKVVFRDKEGNEHPIKEVASALRARGARRTGS